MHLSCQKVSLLILVSTIACHDPAGPATVSANFVLTAINGRPLPTYLAATPGPTTTIISSILTLDKAGKGVMTEHRDDMFLGEGTYTYTFDYKIRGLQIETGPSDACPINSNCLGVRTGMIFNGRLNLVINPDSDLRIVYEYRGSDRL